MSENRYVKLINPEGQIKKGDIVYVVSDILSLAVAEREEGIKFDKKLFVDAFLEIVGEEGTIIFPAFNWDFCKGIAFDMRKTPAKTGTLCNYCLTREDFIRTKHPIYSFAVWGKHAKELAAMDPVNSFGEGTIFDFMYEHDAKGFVVGLKPLAGLTFIHHVEQMVGVPYRYDKNFTADYTDMEGNTSTKTYSMYVRDLDMDPKHIDLFTPLANEMSAKGIIKTHMYKEVPFHMVDLRAMYEVEKEDILNNDSRKMYTYHGQRP